ncbi:MAG: hypothetical protein ACE145_12550 [Terriglobia bacterium]
MTPKGNEASPVTIYMEHRSQTGAFVIIALLLAFLFVVDLYTLSNLNSLRRESGITEAGLRAEVQAARAQSQELRMQLSTLKSLQSREIDRLRAELDTETERVGTTTGQALNRARAMMVAIQKGQELRSSALEQEISQKADTDDLDSLSESVTAAQSELGTAQRTVDTLAHDLGITRSDLGLLATTAREEMQTLRDLNDRQYYEFAVYKNAPHRIPGIGVSLILKKTDVKGQRFNLNVIANDQEMQNKGRNAFEPIFFHLGGLRIPCELVITGVGSDSVAGYVGIPKAALQGNAFMPRT